MPEGLIAVYPGTFDPITNGHLDIIARSLKVVDRLVIAVAKDSSKAPVFALDTRVQLVQAAIEEHGLQDRVDVRGFSGLLVEFVETVGARAILRGLRAVSDFEYEFQMACMNSRLNRDVETIFLTASEATHFIASRVVKQVCALGGDIERFVPAAAGEALRKHYASTRQEDAA